MGYVNDLWKKIKLYRFQVWKFSSQNGETRIHRYSIQDLHDLRRDQDLRWMHNGTQSTQLLYGQKINQFSILSNLQASIFPY